MIAEWEKQILAYCIRISRGTLNTGILKMSVFPDDKANSLGGVTAIQLIDIVSYIARLHENLQDPIRRRGFECSIEIGHNIESLLKETGYDLTILTTNFLLKNHEGYGNEVQFHFNYAPSVSPALVFDNIDIVELNNMNDMNKLLTQQDNHLELAFNQKFIHEFDFVDEIDTQETNQKTHDKNHKKA